MRLAVSVFLILLLGASLPVFALPHGERTSSSNIAPRVSQTFADIERRSPNVFNVIAEIENGIDKGVTVRSLISLPNQGIKHLE